MFLKFPGPANLASWARGYRMVDIGRGIGIFTTLLAMLVGCEHDSS